jgi:hypothetical protein
MQYEPDNARNLRRACLEQRHHHVVAAMSNAVGIAPTLLIAATPS